MQNTSENIIKISLCLFGNQDLIAEIHRISHEYIEHKKGKILGDIPNHLIILIDTDIAMLLKFGDTAMTNITMILLLRVVSIKTRWANVI